VQQVEPALRLAQPLDAHVGQRLGLRRDLVGRRRQVLLALGGLAERELRLTQIEARDRIGGMAGEQVGELHRSDVVARGVEVVDRLRGALIVGARLRVEPGIAVEVGQPLVDVGMVGQILVDRAVALVLDRAEVRHERPHRVRVVAGARHQQHAVFVGLVLVVAGDASQHPGLGELAEPVEQRREHRPDGEQDVQDRRLVVAGDDVAALDVAGLVADHAGQLVVRLREIERADVDVDVAAQGRERVDVGDVEDLDRVRDVFARRLGPQLVRDVVDPLVQQGVGDDDGRVGDLLVVFLADRDLLGGRDRGRGCRDGGTQHHQTEHDGEGPSERHGGFLDADTG